MDNRPLVVGWSGTPAAADASLLVHEPAGRRHLAVHPAGLRARVAVHVGRGPVHALRVARRRRLPLPATGVAPGRRGAQQQRFLAGQ